MKLISLTAIIFLISCGVVPSQPELPLPPELFLPKIQAVEIQCLSDVTAGKLIKRDKLQAARIKTLKSIINSTR